MHQMFPDWLTSLSADAPVNSLPVAEWWNAVDAVTESATAADVVEIARAAFQRPTAEFDTRWRALLREHDSMSPLHGNKRQIAVLAAAALIHLSTSGTRAAAAVYARRCAGHAAWSPALPDLVVRDEDLVARAKDERRMSPWPALKTRPTLNLDAATANLVDGQPVTGEVMKSSLEALALSAGDAILRTARSLSSAGQSREKTLGEQSDVISWLLAGQCRAVDREWEAMSPVAAAVLAAVDLWRITPFEFGRPDYVALINQAVEAAEAPKKGGVKNDELVSALEGAGFAADLPHVDLMPTCQAIASGKTLDAASITIGVRVHDELLLSYVLKQGA